MKSWLFVLCFAPAALLMGAAAEKPAEPPPPIPAAAEFEPFAYFNDRCARCHGPNGAAYGENFARDVPDDKLREIIAEMAAGPAEQELTDPQLDVMMDWHLALRDSALFAALTEATRDETGWNLRGEASAGAILTLHSGTKTWPVEQNEQSWSAQLPKELELEAIQLTAKEGEQTRIWTLVEPKKLVVAEETIVEAAK